MVGGPKTFGRTKKLNSIRSLGDQTTWGTNKIQEAGRGRKLNIHIQLDKSILIKLWGSQNKKYALLMILKMSKFRRFLGGPNGPKICAKRTKTDFKDRVPDFLLDQMTSRIMNKLSSLLVSILPLVALV